MPRVSPWRGLDKRGQALLVRQALGKDAARYLAHLGRLVGETPFMLQGPEDPLPSGSEQEGWLDRAAASGNGLCLVALRPIDGGWFARERIVASLTLVVGRTRRTRHHAYLGMGVERAHWQRGIGARLLDMALEWARAHPIIARVSLQVYLANQAALALYRSRGFLVEGTLVSEARDGQVWVDLVGMGLDVGRLWSAP
jgi:RimJ/RimL family protein N-acetyltransferase